MTAGGGPEDQNRRYQQHCNSERRFQHDRTREPGFQFALLLSFGFLQFRQARGLFAEMKVVDPTENQHEHYKQKLKQESSSVCSGPKRPKTIDMNPRVVQAGEYKYDHRRNGNSGIQPDDLMKHTGSFGSI